MGELRVVVLVILTSLAEVDSEVTNVASFVYTVVEIKDDVSTVTVLEVDVKYDKLKVVVDDKFKEEEGIIDEGIDEAINSESVEAIFSEVVDDTINCDAMAISMEDDIASSNEESTKSISPDPNDPMPLQ